MLVTVLQVRCHESGEEGESPLPRPAGDADFEAAQGAVGCKKLQPLSQQGTGLVYGFSKSSLV